MESASQIISLFLPVYFSSQVGIIVSHIYNKTSADGIILQTLFIILLLSLISPFAAFLSAKVFLKKSVLHDGANLKLILQKDISQVHNSGSGSILQLFESDLIEYRLKLRTLIVTPIVVAVLTAVLFIQSSNIIFLLTVFCVSAIPILFNKLYSHLEGIYYSHSAAYNNSRIAFEENIVNNKIPLILFSLKENILKLYNKEYNSYINKHAKKNIINLSLSKAVLGLCKYSIQVLIIISFSFLFKSVSIENLVASLFLIYPIGQIIELLIEWVQIIPFMKIINGRVNFFLNFDNSNIPKTGYENIETKNLVYTISGRKFSFPDIKIKKGNKFLIEGANGTGKSIFLKILAGEVKPQAGEIIFSNPVKEALGYVPQTSLLFNTGIKENITLGNEIPENEINKMLKTFSLEKTAERNFAEKDDINFSGGEIKKTDILRSLLNSTGILILDEPTNNLDNKSVEELIKILKTKTVVFTSHDKRLKEITDNTIKIDN